jgi:medium-chain acyl-[acyl-carrier-protein] hydrolase
MEISRFGFKIHSFDSDAFGVVTVPRLLGSLLESAGGSADALGFGIRELQQRGLTWVIGRIRIDIDEAISVGDEIQVETWPSGIERTVALRDFRISKQGRAVGRATSLWFVLDMETRLPLRPNKILPERFHPQTPHLVSLPKVVPPIPSPVTRQRKYGVRQADIDLNQHVTAASYVAWAVEAVPEDLWRSQRLASLDIQFLEECHLGSSILSESHLLDESALVHRITRENDGKELARLTSNWSPR